MQAIILPRRFNKVISLERLRESSDWIMLKVETYISMPGIEFPANDKFCCHDDKYMLSLLILLTTPPKKMAADTTQLSMARKRLSMSRKRRRNESWEIANTTLLDLGTNIRTTDPSTPTFQPTRPPSIKTEVICLDDYEETDTSFSITSETSQGIKKSIN